MIRPSDFSERPAFVGATLKRAADSLAAVSETPRLDAEVLLAFATSGSRGSLLASPERELVPDVVARFAKLLVRRVAGEPVAYLLGTREFYSMPITVSADVLIPRPETELLVQLTLLATSGVAQPSVLDVGTGSGAIALAVKRTLAHVQVTASDVSAAALAVARENAARLSLDVTFVQSSWFQSFDAQAFNIIASNPPYVRSEDVRGGLRFEPRIALDGGSDGLDAYRALLAGAGAHLVSPAGVLLLEHGHDQRAELTQLARDNGWRVKAEHDDMAYRPRVLELERSAS